MTNYKHLFEPIEIRKLKIKNRIAMAPMNMAYSAPNGYVGDQQLAWYGARAKGGFGLIITEAVTVNPHRWMGGEGVNVARLTDTRFSRYWSKIVKLVHSHDAHIFIQLVPGFGRQGHAAVESPDIPSGAPSAIPTELDMRRMNKGWQKQAKRTNPDFHAMIGDEFYEHIKTVSDEEYAGQVQTIYDFLAKNDPEILYLIRGHTPRELTKEEIVDLEDRMAHQSLEAFKLDFDGVEIHAPHGYLVASFLSPRANKRTDEYGGSIENRGRFLVNIVKKIRDRVGSKRAVGVRISGAELMPGGMTHDEARQFAAMARDAGADFINVSQGSYENPGAFAPDGEDEFTRWGPGFKESTGLPVIIPGFITPQAANRAIEEGKTDLISLGRQAIADPFWSAKIEAGREKDIVKCSRCDNCYMNLFERKWINCEVNPTAGHELFYPEMWLRGSETERRARKYLARAEGLL